MGFRYRSRPDPHSGHGTGLVLRPRNDRLFLQAPVAHLRLPKVGRAVATGASPKPGANRRGECSGDRVCAQPEKLSQRRPGQADPGETRGAPGSGVHSVGHGAVRQLQAVARHDKPSHKTYLKPDDGKCLHYYVYFLDDDLGLCSLRVPTWCPFRLQFYCNGHSYLARQMSQRHLEFRALNNAFGCIADFEPAQKLADEFGVERLHRKLDGFADRYCPVVKQLGLTYHWSLDQVEFATDIVFRQPSDLQAIYERLTRTAIHTVKPDNVATFLGRKLNGNYQDEMGNRFNTRIEGTRIKHTMGPVSIKMYDKFQLILRIETTVVNVSFFKHYREVEHKNGTRSMAGPR